ncbi:hypothetical protein [Streptomyces niveus]|uniref:hypothetical protein n=1 Tax=Streptomyces niveus TaxID=193462 RepID=UPI00369CC094
MPFSDIHLQLHAIRAAELHAEAATHLPQDRPLRLRLGWLLVELGLRLVQHPARTPRIRAV